MDIAIVRMLLQSIIDGDPSDEAEHREVLRWLKERIYLASNDKGASTPQYQPHIESAYNNTKQNILGGL